MVVELFAQVDGGQSLTGAILFFSVSLLSVIYVMLQFSIFIY